MSSEQKPAFLPQSFRGVIAPLALPLLETREIDFQSLDRQIDFLLAGGVDGLWVNGTTGEFFALNGQERAEVVEATVRRAAGRVPIVAQVGDTSSRRALRHAGRAVEAGADAIAAVPPYYMTYSQQELRNYYRRIAEAVDLPLFLYQIPQTCKVSLDVPSIVELAREGVLAGIKDSAGNIDFYHKLVRETSRAKVDLLCFYGVSSLVDMGLYTGGHGVMSAIANLVPHLCKQACQAADAQDWATVKKINSEILGLMDTLSLPGRQGLAPLVACYKWILRELGVIATDTVFEPLQPLSSTEQDLLREGPLPMANALCADLLATTSAR